MDSGYYYYFDDCNLINYTNYLRGNKNEKEGYEKLQELKEKWKDKYATAFKIWELNWDSICHFFNFLNQ